MRIAGTTLRFADALASVSLAELRDMAAAAETVLEMQDIAAKTGHNIVGEVLRGEGAFVEWQHYPADDAYDPESHAQYYYHAHPSEERFDGEHGHFHLFLRGSGMPEGLVPIAGQAHPPSREAILCHLAGISMDAYGQPFRLFTTNRWVTGDTWYSAADMAAMLHHFRMETVRPNLAVNQWITAMVRLYWPHILALLHARDRAVAARREAAAEADIFEDRGFELPSWMDVDPERDLSAIESAVARQSAG